jgi:hypothetical protein
VLPTLWVVVTGSLLTQEIAPGFECLS